MMMMTDLERHGRESADRVAYQRVPEEFDPFWEDAQTWHEEAEDSQRGGATSMADSNDQRVQPVLHAVQPGDVDRLRAALEADPGAVDLKIGGDTMLELMTQPEGGPPVPEIVGVADATYPSPVGPGSPVPPVPPVPAVPLVPAGSSESLCSSDAAGGTGAR